jgi:hypothetical protein
MSICKTRFITTDEIKSYTLITANVHDSKFEHNIEYVQISSLRPILSESLYDQIDAQIVASTLTVLNTTLLNTYIKPYLAQRIFEQSMLGLHSEVSPTGIQTRSPDSSTSVDTSMVKMMINDAKGKADHYQELMVSYLSVNQSDYPEYATTSTKEQRSEAPTSGMFVFDNTSTRDNRCRRNCRNWPNCACNYD